MKKQSRPLWLLSALAFVLSVGLALTAQQTTPQQGQSNDQQAQPTPPPAAQTPAPPTSDEPAPPPNGQSPAAPAPPSSASPSTPPQPPTGTAGQSPDPNGVQTFSGTIVKEGDRYMLHDEASGQTYDLDHQDEVQKYAGKRVRVHGTLDPTGKMIHLQ
jgi:outer membrane biosynthesis protein TonB